MNRKVKIFLGCTVVFLIIIVCVVLVISLLHRRNSTIIDVPVVETSQVEAESTVAIKGEDITAPSNDRANIPKEPLSESEGNLLIRVSEKAGGLRQDVMIDATRDYCIDNGIVGDVVIDDASVDGDIFTLKILNGGSVYTFSFSLDDYV